MGRSADQVPAPERRGRGITSDPVSHDEAGRSTSVRRLEPALKARAANLGFEVCRIARLADLKDLGAVLSSFVAAGRHGDMGWIADTLERRRHPLALWPEARSAVVVGHSYAPAHDPIERLAEQDRGVVSCYAKGRDYHDVMKGRLKELAGVLASHSGADVKVFVDTAPLMEKPLAELAGLGWQGKHTNLVSRAHGSWLLIGTILTTAVLFADASESDHCGSCRACLEICPTGAFPAPYQLDARRCIAYLTIEHKGQIPSEFRPAIGNRIYGCDDCLAVCPWNKFAAASREAKYQATPATDDPPLAALVALDDPTFRQRFAGTAIKRIGRDRFIRNVLVAIGNTRDPQYQDAVMRLLDDASPLVRGMAVWALSQIAASHVFRKIRALRRDREQEPAVQLEWDHNAQHQ